MYRFILKRILLLIPIVIVIVFIVFTIMSFTPGDPGSMILGINAPKESIDQLNEKFGYNNPFFVRFVDYVGNAIKGDFGVSYRTGTPVFNEIFSRFPTTLLMAVLAVITTILVGIPIGILSAVKQYSIADVMSTVTAMLMSVIPGFWMGLMMVILFSLKLGWLPPNGVGSILHFIMPTLVLGIPSAANIMRFTRTAMLETIRQDYIRTARAKGAPEKRVIWTHALKNALLPVITILGMEFGGLLGGAVIIESVFSIPGVGNLMLTAIRQKDIPQVMAGVIFLAVLFICIMLLIDIVHAFVDPRIKARYVKL